MNNKERTDNNNDFKRIIKSIKIFISKENNINFEILVNNLIEFAMRIKQDRDSLLLKLTGKREEEYNNFCKIFEEMVKAKKVNIKNVEDNDLLLHYFRSDNNIIREENCQKELHNEPI